MDCKHNKRDNEMKEKSSRKILSGACTVASISLYHTVNKRHSRPSLAADLAAITFHQELNDVQALIYCKYKSTQVK